MRASAPASQHQFSSICDGASTKSLSTAVPAKREKVGSEEQSPCMQCPNSWKKVSTSECLSSEGSSSVGFVKLHTHAEMGSCRAPPGRVQAGCRPQHAAWPYLPSRGCMSR